MAAISENGAARLELELRDLAATVGDHHLQLLLRQCFAVDCELWVNYRAAPAAKRHHQAYMHGLLEHSLTVAQAVSAMAAIFGGVDRDLAVTGALLHDIGKLDAYAQCNGAIEMTDLGRLHGEIALGYYRVKREIERIDGFPPEREQALLHIILSHHGQREYGSPVVPCTREAALVHAADDIGARLGSFDRIEESRSPGVRWSSFDKALGSAVYFGPVAPDAFEAGDDAFGPGAEAPNPMRAVA